MEQVSELVPTSSLLRHLDRRLVDLLPGAQKGAVRVTHLDANLLPADVRRFLVFVREFLLLDAVEGGLLRRRHSVGNTADFVLAGSVDGPQSIAGGVVNSESRDALNAATVVEFEGDFSVFHLHFLERESARSDRVLYHLFRRGLVRWFLRSRRWGRPIG